MQRKEINLAFFASSRFSFSGEQTRQAVNLKGIKSRAIRHTDYCIIDGYEGYALVHVGLLIRQGRPLPIQQEAAKHVMVELKKRLGADWIHTR